MKLCRYGRNGFEKPGMIDAEGRLRDLAKVVENIGPKELSPRGLKMLAKVKPGSLPVVANGPRLGVPFVGIGKFVAIGLNYSDHATEPLAIPPSLLVFMKRPPASRAERRHRPAQALDQARWEVELGCHRQQAHTSTKRTLSAMVPGYCVVNDVSDAPSSSSPAVGPGKGFDTAGPIGPWLVTTDEITDPQRLDCGWMSTARACSRAHAPHGLRLRDIVSHVSQYMTLMPGDIIHHGTPPGVGMGSRQPGVPQAGRCAHARDPRAG